MLWLLVYSTSILCLLLFVPIASLIFNWWDGCIFEEIRLRLLYISRLYLNIWFLSCYSLNSFLSLLLCSCHCRLFWSRQSLSNSFLQRLFLNWCRHHRILHPQNFTSLLFLIFLLPFCLLHNHLNLLLQFSFVLNSFLLSITNLFNIWRGLYLNPLTLYNDLLICNFKRLLEWKHLRTE